MENIGESRAEKFGKYLGQSRYAYIFFSSKKSFYISFFMFLLVGHSLYWFSPWLTPIPFILFSALGIWVGGGIFKPWETIIKQAMYMPDYDSNILKISIPFIAVNWVAIFACLYMLGTVTEGGVPIEGVWKHFYFSAVTLTTLGYGNIVPASTFTEILVTVESLVGFLGFAILAGVITSIIMKRVE